MNAEDHERIKQETVHRWNCHEELVAALETCVQAFGAASTASADSWTVQCDRAEQQASAALAKAKGTT